MNWPVYSRASIGADLFQGHPPGRILCLAGNYAEHVAERGGTVAERQETFPYVFWKPTETLLLDNQQLKLPGLMPTGVDWEVELGVVIGKPMKNVPEAEALSYVAGYTIVNDFSHRTYRPNSGRKKRERDVFFDWQHGKWFDTFCAVGPRLVPAQDIPDPQNLKLRLEVNGKIKQDGTTAQMIFPVAAILAFLSEMMTLYPGDLISTGTPKGVGAAKGEYLQSGDVVVASIETIGTLTTHVVMDAN